MKTRLYILLITGIVASCSSNNDLSDAYGNFEVDDVIISSEANGKLVHFNVHEGLKIQKNETVALVDTTDLALKRLQLIAQKKATGSKMDNIRSQIDVQQQQKRNLIVDQERIDKLFKDGAATQKQVDDIKGAIDLVNQQIASIQTQKTSVSAELDVLNTQIAQVEESISKCRIVNPISGVVLEKYAEPDEITAFGKPLYKIADVDTMTLRVYVSGSQLPHIRLGQQVQVLIDSTISANSTLPGTISWISESAEFTPKIIQTKEERVNMVYAVKVRVKNDGSLKIGMPGEVRF